VKPENVLLADDGRVKVADFGLARAAANLEATSATSLIGTVAYLSPEQVIRGIADERSDVYSAGVMLFEMLTGRPPYDGETAVSVALKHAHEDVPPPSSLVSGIPTSVDLLVARATARDPDRRPHDAGAFLAEVVRVRGGLVMSDADDGNLTTLLNRTLVVELPDTRTVGPNPPWQSGQSGQSANAAAPPPRVAEPPEPPRPPEDEYRRPHPHRKGWIAFFIILLLAAAAAAAGWWFAAGRWTHTPNLTKLSSSAAMERAKSAHVTVQVGAPEFSSTVPKDAVVEQTPTAEQKVLRGDTVTIRLSQGPQLFQVPLYDPAGGTSLVDYKSELIAAHLNIADPPTTQYSPTVIAGNVISVDPAVGQNEKAGTTVTVTVSLGPEPITIIDYTGQPADQATTALTTAGFNVVPTQDYSTTVKAGLVISQTPPGGSGKLGDTITLDISKGPQLFKVPNVTSKLTDDPKNWVSIDQATRTLTDAGFKVKVGSSGRFGVVTSQSPKGLSMQPLGTVITIYAQ
jgi:serine/threonine-protein kinase